MYRRPVALSSASAVLSAAALLLSLSPSAHADDEINPDRPDFMDSSSVVGPGRLQLETGLSLLRDKSQGLSSRGHSLPLMLRMGLSENWELRVETEALMQLRSSYGGISNTWRGTGDLSLSAKWNLQDADEQSGSPGLAWVFQVDKDTGSAAFRGRGTSPQARFVAEWALAGDASVGLMAGVYRDRNDNNKRYWGGLAAVGASMPLADKWRGFVELAAQRLASSRNEERQSSFDLGLNYLVSKEVQLDTMLSRGLSRGSPDWGWTAGVSVRF